MADFVLEIGSEEVPSSFLSKQEISLLQLLESRLAEAGLRYKSIRTFSTPRRLVAVIENLAPAQEVSEEIITGPAVTIAYDKEGAPTKALTGFCLGQKCELSQLTTIQTSKGEYVVLKRKKGGKPASEVLAAILPEVILSLPFPKKMRWSDHHLHYIRPVKWIMAMLDDQVINFSLGHIQAGNMSQGHRIHGSGAFTVPHANQFIRLLSAAGVVPETQARKKIIKEQGDSLAAAVKGDIVWKDELLDEVCGLVEHPVPILGSFAEKYLEIPEEILLTSMETHQKSFGIRGNSNKLLPLFLTVLNLEPPDEKLVRQGWEKVLAARLEDARFFWHEDLKASFPVWQKKLDKVIFLGPLGSVAEKEKRIADLAEWLAKKTGLANPEIAKRAGSLSKADLVSGVVGEFPVLQGIMGGIYASKAGEEETVANAIREQYLPTGLDSPIPATSCGAILALADKADTLAGCFGLGRIPTGAADQDGSRRAALGIIRIMLGYNIKIQTNKIFTKALELYGKKKWKWSETEILGKLEDFMQARLRNWLIRLGYNNIIVDAVLAKTPFAPWLAEKKVKSLQAFYDRGNASTILALFKRMENITRQHSVEGNWQEELLESREEKSLAEILKVELPVVDQLLEKEDYAGALDRIAAFSDAVNSFFENTMILCEDKNLSQNRLRLISSILDRLGKIADFSRLQAV